MVEGNLGMNSQRDVSALVTEGAPTGHCTIWAFLHRTEPWIFAGLDDPVLDVLEDQARAERIAFAQGVATFPLPLLAHEHDIDRIVAFPEWFLRDFYPAVP